jgi:hypothetical protein
LALDLANQLLERAIGKHRTFTDPRVILRRYAVIRCLNTHSPTSCPIVESIASPPETDSMTVPTNATPE